MSDDTMGVPGPGISVLRAASANLMGLRLGGQLGRVVQGAAALERYYVTAETLGATREQAKAALCGTAAPTDEDRDAALRRFKDGTPPMSEALRETVRYLVQSSPASFADIASAAELLGKRTASNAAFTPWTDAHLAENLPGLVDMAVVGRCLVTQAAWMVRETSA